MTQAESHQSSVLKRWPWKSVGWLFKAFGFLVRVLVLGWATLAIYFSNLPWAWARLTLAIVFAVFGIWALWLTRKRHMSWAFVAAFAAVFVWWGFILPSHDRQWRTDVAVMPRAFIDGDVVRITGVRNFEYRSRDDFTERYEDREVLLSHLTGVDFFVSYWVLGPIGHTFLSFTFDNAPPLSVSIETRPEAHEGYDPLASMFKKYELIYVVGEESDLVRVRTNYRNEDVFLYRLRIPAANARELFLIYLQRINELADGAEFYHLLSNSCTINIVRYANLAGRAGRLDIRHVFNGWIDRYFYNAGLVDRTLPFDELRRQSHINEAALAAPPGADFSQSIRAGLPGQSH